MTIQSTAVFPKTATTIIRAKRASQQWPTAEDILSPKMTFGLLLKWHLACCWNDIWVAAEMTIGVMLKWPNWVWLTWQIRLLLNQGLFTVLCSSHLPLDAQEGTVSQLTLSGDFNSDSVRSNSPAKDFQRIFNFQFWQCRIKLPRKKTFQKIFKGFSILTVSDQTQMSKTENPAKEIQCFIRFAFMMCLHLGSFNIWFHTLQNYIYKRNRETLSSTTLTNLLVENIELCEVWEGGWEESRVVAGRRRVDQHWTDHLALHSENCSDIVTLVAFVWLVSTVCFQMCPQTMQILDFKILKRMNWKMGPNLSLLLFSLWSQLWFLVWFLTFGRKCSVDKSSSFGNFSANNVFLSAI